MDDSEGVQANTFKMLRYSKRVLPDTATLVSLHEYIHHQIFLRLEFKAPLVPCASLTEKAMAEPLKYRWSDLDAEAPVYPSMNALVALILLVPALRNVV